MLYPMVLAPVFKEYLWGGRNLAAKYGKKTDLKTIAESWELACHRDGVSIITNGAFQNKKLDAYLEENGCGVLGADKCANGMPLLVKLIDAADNLSIQVHPDACFAAENEQQPGKKELWYIMDCEPDASIFYGFNKKISKEEFVSRAKDGSILDVLNRVAVRAGDVFFIDSGTVHAIGKGLTVAEIGNNCNVTYRIFDFFRKDQSGQPRDLHIDKAAKVANLDVPKQYAFDENGVLDCGDFLVHEIRLRGILELTADDRSFHNLLCTKGECVLSYEEQEIKILQGTSIFIPAGMGVYSLRGDGVLLKTTV
jgi:mannose-6-phosphate isomerase